MPQQKLSLLPAATILLLGITTAIQQIAAQDVLSPQIPQELAQCSNVTLSWTATAAAGTANQAYTAVIVSPNDPNIAADSIITYLGQVNDSTTYNWQVAMPAGTNISLKVTDSDGNYGLSAPAIVQNGSSSCLPTGLDEDGDSSTIDHGDGPSSGSLTILPLSSHSLTIGALAVLLSCASSAVGM